MTLIAILLIMELIIIIEKLIVTDNGRMVPIESNLVSPYLNNGQQDLFVL